MKRDVYEIFLLEIRQGLKDQEQLLLSAGCISIVSYRRLVSAKKQVQSELLNYRMGNKQTQNKQIVNLMEG